MSFINIQRHKFLPIKMSTIPILIYMDLYENNAEDLNIMNARIHKTLDFKLKAMWTSKSTQFHYLINKHSTVYLEKQFCQALPVCKYYAQIFFVRFYQHFHEICTF